jgi:hypothetical protein
MPISRYNRYFGGDRGAAQKALENMKRTYGAKKGEAVFYGTVAKRERKANRNPGRRR